MTTDPLPIKCPYCSAAPGEHCTRSKNRPATFPHLLRKYAAMLAGLIPRGHIPADQSHLLNDPQALKNYRARMQARRRHGIIQT